MLVSNYSLCNDPGPRPGHGLAGYDKVGTHSLPTRANGTRIDPRNEELVARADIIPSKSAEAEPPRRRRLTAEARKSSILAAARRAFSETGDMNGTTIKTIAEHSGISEGIIYRHFESKDQLFFEAVVEPLREAVDDLVAATETVDRDESLTPERQVQTMQGLYRQL